MATSGAPVSLCACSRYSVLIKVSETTAESVWRQRTTECTSTTQSTYAQGHDAKLRRFLVLAGVEGHRVRHAQGEMVVEADALRVATGLGWGDAVREGIERGRSRGNPG